MQVLPSETNKQKISNMQRALADVRMTQADPSWDQDRVRVYVTTIVVGRRLRCAMSSAAVYNGFVAIGTVTSVTGQANAITACIVDWKDVGGRVFPIPNGDIPGLLIHDIREDQGGNDWLTTLALAPERTDRLIEFDAFDCASYAIYLDGANPAARQRELFQLIQLIRTANNLSGGAARNASATPTGQKRNFEQQTQNALILALTVWARNCLAIVGGDWRTADNLMMADNINAALGAFVVKNANGRLDQYYNELEKETGLRGRISRAIKISCAPRVKGTGNGDDPQSGGH